jgi:thiamine biosynthesis lipoprotein
MLSLQSTHYAMATEFELLVYGDRETYLQSVTEAVFAEISRLEAQLSFYAPGSDISDLNRRAAHGPVVVEPRLFHLLQRAQALSEATGGAFDPTVAPLMRCWGFVGASGSMPTAEAIEAARERVGMHHIHLDNAAFTVEFDREGVQLDLGAIGKGYSVECAVELLREFEIEAALLHGGASTVYALGWPPDAEAWTVAVQRPFDPMPGRYLTQFRLRDESLSVSAPHGKWFASEGRRYGHVIDPRTGYPAGNALLAALVTPSATDGDALSTALLTLGPDGLALLGRLLPGCRALVATAPRSDPAADPTGEIDVSTWGIDPLPTDQCGS